MVGTLAPQHRDRPVRSEQSDHHKMKPDIKREGLDQSCPEPGPNEQCNGWGKAVIPIFALAGGCCVHGPCAIGSNFDTPPVRRKRCSGAFGS